MFLRKLPCVESRRGVSQPMMEEMTHPISMHASHAIRKGGSVELCRGHVLMYVQIVAEECFYP